MRSLKSISNLFLEQFPQSVDKGALLIETLRNLCEIFGAEIDTKLLSHPESYGERLDCDDIMCVIQLSYVGHDQYADGEPRMISYALLTGPTRVIAWRSLQSQCDPEDIGFGSDGAKGILGFFINCCRANIQVSDKQIQEITESCLVGPIN